MSNLVMMSVLSILSVVAVLAIYLFVVGSQLTRVGNLLEECAELVWKIKANADPIKPGLDHINRTGGVVAGALPLLYGFAEGIVTGVSPQTERQGGLTPEDRAPARPASGTRRSRLHDGVGYRPAGAPVVALHGRRTGV